MRFSIAIMVLLFLSCGQGNKAASKVQKNENQEEPYSKQKNQNISEENLDAPAIPNVKQVEEINIQNLYKAMEERDEEEFLRQFPSNFERFQYYFGWDTPNDAPHELYEHSVHYIEYLFYLLRTNKYPTYEKNIITICENGQWEADGVNYFQHHVLKHIKENDKYDLINDLDEERAKSVLFFLFDGPHPKPDTEFAAHLSTSKKAILEELFESGFYDENENPDPFPDNETISFNLSDFEGTEHFFIRDIDINNDGVLDKIVSADQYQGDELFLFINKEDEYQFTLKTTNFSEDGGNQIVDVVAEDEGFIVKTAFLDGGLQEADYHITFKDKVWMLTHTVYKTQSSNQEDAFIYVCNMVQELNLEYGNFFEKLNGMPDETKRQRICTKEKIN